MFKPPSHQVGIITQHVMGQILCISGRPQKLLGILYFAPPTAGGGPESLLNVERFIKGMTEVGMEKRFYAWTLKMYSCDISESSSKVGREFVLSLGMVHVLRGRASCGIVGTRGLAGGGRQSPGQQASDRSATGSGQGSRVTSGSWVQLVREKGQVCPCQFGIVTLHLTSGTGQSVLYPTTSAKLKRQPEAVATECYIVPQAHGEEDGWTNDLHLHIFSTSFTT
ncbi:predicted protein [Pyrenophora tritici-repentis Pt-1C-BFP]|uniref:Uncharacterized protein n=1 Tax=Pyrenophora tritici-repentis (strain Pt-1C-BFP) TaxID=426418 RepID=B2WFW1_PYRTR|nr:uncharacterized protein PTRG_08817 [Pyrenophora tritici-repentis Pt-1C-BFP]EDU41868.1 predicted protein [Pyrenophora tritici-repentis Pt-1C-BFP]